MRKKAKEERQTFLDHTRKEVWEKRRGEKDIYTPLGFRRERLIIIGSGKSGIFLNLNEFVLEMLYVVLKMYF